MTELDNYAQMLDEAGIEYERITEYNPFDITVMLFNQVLVRGIGDSRFSAVCHHGSYGFEDGLIEVWDYGNEDPVGFLTAEDAFALLEDWRQLND